MKIETIVVATDFSEAAAHAIETAADFARHFEAELVVVHAYNVEIPVASPIMTGGYVLPEGFIDQIRQQAQHEVDKIAKDLKGRGIAAIGIAVDAPPASAVIETAEQKNADLIVMGTRGLTGLKHVALGSVADRVVRTATCPVLTVGKD